MNARIRIVAGNWKMHTTVAEGIALARRLSADWKGDSGRQMYIAPPFTHLSDLRPLLVGSEIRLAAQNCHWELSGAYTGEVSASMLEGLGVRHVILGHSERRQSFRETNETVRRKISAALQVGISVIFCCGELLEMRESGGELAFVQQQLEECLLHFSAEQMRSVIIAYEPVWAIGTGVTASALQAQDMHRFIRQFLVAAYSQELADQTTILYGGSVKSNNAAELFAQPDVDGGLVGGASLNASEFLKIAAAL